MSHSFIHSFMALAPNGPKFELFLLPIWRVGKVALALTTRPEQV